MDPAVRKWRSEGKHLPVFMRDFHDAKDVFKSIDQYLVFDPEHEHMKISWLQAHCYTIESFLWFMAEHGYTLQKSRSRLPFSDLEAKLNALKSERDDRSANIIKAVIQPKQDKE